MGGTAKIGPRRQQVLDRVRSAFAGSDGWCFVPGAGYTVRWGEICPTPEYVRRPYLGTRSLWDQDTYSRLVFVTLVGSVTNFSVLVRVCSAPWVGAQDTSATLTRALQVLEDPGCVFAGR